ncbi:MAG: hypothetical protein AAF092_00205 [Pseudomonadota bacterium]
MAQPGTKLIIERLPKTPDYAALLPILERVSDGPCTVTLDGSRIADLPAPGLEALLVLAATQRARGDGFSMENLSEPAQADLALYGVTPEHLKGP